jgi:hypothetical protein
MTKQEEADKALAELNRLSSQKIITPFPDNEKYSKLRREERINHFNKIGKMNATPKEHFIHEINQINNTSDYYNKFEKKELISLLNCLSNEDFDSLLELIKSERNGNRYGYWDQEQLSVIKRIISGYDHQKNIVISNLFSIGFFVNTDDTAKNQNEWIKFTKLFSNFRFMIEDIGVFENLGPSEYIDIKEYYE